MAMHHVPEAAVVLMDVATGKILVYASHVEKGPPRDLCVEATAPAASVFKIITASALVEQAGVTADQRECYSGGEQRIVEKDLVPDLKRDRWCTTVAGAMGRSINTVFARLALKNLKPARPRGDGQVARLRLAAAVRRRGAAQRGALPGRPARLCAHRRRLLEHDALAAPRGMAQRDDRARRRARASSLVAATSRDGGGDVFWTAPTGLAQKRAIKQTTADAVTTMMETTVSDGTSYRAFHDPKGQPFLPNVGVAGKTGTLTDPTNGRFYTWFTGFAPSHPIVIADGDKPAVSPPRRSRSRCSSSTTRTGRLRRTSSRARCCAPTSRRRRVPNVTTRSCAEPARRVTEAAGEDRLARSRRSPPAQPSTTPGTKASAGSAARSRRAADEELTFGRPRAAASGVAAAPHCVHTACSFVTYSAMP